LEILIAEDERSIAVPLADDLEEAGHSVRWESTGVAAMRAIEESVFDAIVTDVRMPGASGIDLLRQVKARRPETEVLVVTGYATVEQAVEAMRAGAFDYIQKPFLNEVLIERLEQVRRLRELQEENARLRSEAAGEEEPELEQLIGQSRKMLDVLKLARTVAPSDTTVLIEGESGTGKERFARAIHKLSDRRRGPFIAISIGALPETLLEDELFGHERGAFTDAARARRGRFELADGGTIFLDDIDDMPMSVQVKLLRVLQEREFERVGGEKTVPVNIRVVSATKVALEERVREGTFREDLFYRLKVVPLKLPPLRERLDDIPLLTAHFVQRYGAGRDFEVRPEDLDAMMRYDWPGNIRQLENHIERAIALSGGKKTLRVEHLLPEGLQPADVRSAPPNQETRTLREVLVETEKEHLRLVLTSLGGHRTKASKVLGISRKVLWEKLKDYQIDV
jgi:DNA-binding NtrC family response regulator